MRYELRSFAAARHRFGEYLPVRPRYLSATEKVVEYASGVGVGFWRFSWGDFRELGISRNPLLENQGSGGGGIDRGEKREVWIGWGELCGGMVRGYASFCSAMD